jgi:predicted ATPase
MGITNISISGFKSIANECSIEVRPLTILAGANSSGKSSIMQPILLMKQTLEAPYDAGSLLLNGSHVKFTSVEQLLSKSFDGDYFTFEIEINKKESLKNIFKKAEKRGIELVEMTHRDEIEVTLSTSLTENEIKEVAPKILHDLYNQISSDAETKSIEWFIVRDRCFLSIELRRNHLKALSYSKLKSSPSETFSRFIQKLIHVSGLRVNLDRTFPVTGIDLHFLGNFEQYVASLINSWQNSDIPKLQELNSYLIKLDLARRIESILINDAQLELKVSRTRNSDDMVNIVDVGSGVSQILPTIVALIAAEPDQLVYLEEPEIHLHPRAQANLGDIIVDAANRGVRVVLETHSDLLLRRIQSLVAEDKISPDKAILHWFSRDQNGFTQIATAEMDSTGAFGDFPEDFSEVDLQEESRYIEAAETKLLGMV